MARPAKDKAAPSGTGQAAWQTTETPHAANMAMAWRGNGQAFLTAHLRRCPDEPWRLDVTAAGLVTHATALQGPLGVGDGNGSETTGNVTDSSTTDDGAVDVPGSGPEAAESGAGTDNAYGTDAANGDVAGDAGDDAFSVDARGKKICPTTISGSLDPSDATQVGRHSRYAPASACGTTKDFPGNGADPTNSHLYDAYHFINVDGAPVCFTFTLTYPGSQQLYAAAYSAFEPTNIARGYLGDVGGVLTSPQTMGITVGGGATIEVVVYAIALGTATAGSYTLSCSTE
jgi:hypothetical protein